MRTFVTVVEVAGRRFALSTIGTDDLTASLTRRFPRGSVSVVVPPRPVSYAHLQSAFEEGRHAEVRPLRKIRG